MTIDDTTTTLSTMAEEAVIEDVAKEIDYSIDSAIYYNFVDDDNGRTRQRIGHVSGIYPITDGSPDAQEPVWFMYLLASAYMGLEHFNSRNGAVIPELPKILEVCDFQMTMDIRDDQFNKGKAVTALMDATTTTTLSNGNSSHSSSSRPPFAIFGSLTSGVSSTLSILADALQIVEVSGTSTSPSLDKSRHFTRTVPTSDGESAAIMTYFRKMNITTRVGILYVQDAYGVGLQEALHQQAHNNNITITISMPYQENEESVEESIKLLKASEVRYIILVWSNHFWKPVFRAAYAHNIIGSKSGRQWYAPEYHSAIHDDFSLDISSEADIAEALHGMGLIHISFEEHDGFDTEFQKMFEEKEEDDNDDNVAELILAEEGEDSGSNQTTPSTRSTILERFISSHLDQEIYDNAQLPPQRPIVHNYFMYDAMMALGIAACRTPGQFTTEEFLAQLLQSEFPGVSGWVALDRETGSRQVKDIGYEIVNFLQSPSTSTNTSIRFTTTTTALVKGTNTTHLQGASFVYSDNTTIPPAEIPPVTSHDYNLIPMWALAIGWVLGGLAMLTSVGFASWTIYNRVHHVLRVSQPIFLCQLCLGTFIMATAIIPLGMQEQEDTNNNSLSSKWNLDVACMAVPWLQCIGFVTALSAILAKTLRLNKLMKSSSGMKRVSVKPIHVLQPLVVLMTCSVILLTLTSTLAPYTWHRIPSENNVDRYGRSLESVGTCQHYVPSGSATGTEPKTIYFMLPLWIINFIGLGVAAWHCYKARDLPVEMAESAYLFVATISLMEVVLIGGPILLLPTLSPTAQYLAMSSIISLACFSILLPIFVPKYQHHQAFDEQPGSGHLVDMRAISGRSIGVSHHSIGVSHHSGRPTMNKKRFVSSNPEFSLTSDLMDDTMAISGRSIGGSHHLSNPSFNKKRLGSSNQDISSTRLGTDHMDDTMMRISGWSIGGSHHRSKPSLNKKNLESSSQDFSSTRSGSDRMVDMMAISRRTSGGCHRSNPSLNKKRFGSSNEDVSWKRG